MRLWIPFALGLVLLGNTALAEPEGEEGSDDTQTWSWSFDLPGTRLGVRVMNMTNELRVYFGAPEDTGVLVSQVEAGSPAEEAGIRVGDVVVEIAGQSIERPDQLVHAVMTSSDEAVAITVIRDGERMPLEAQLRGEPMAAGHDFEVATPEGEIYRFHLRGGEGPRRHFGLFAPEGWFESHPQVELMPGRERMEELQRRLEELEDRIRQLEERLEE